MRHLKRCDFYRYATTGSEIECEFVGVFHLFGVDSHLCAGFHFLAAIGVDDCFVLLAWVEK